MITPVDASAALLAGLLGSGEGGLGVGPSEGASVPVSFAEGRATAYRGLGITLPHAMRGALEARMKDGTLLVRVKEERAKARKAGLRGAPLDAAVTMVLLIDLVAEVKDTLRRAARQEATHVQALRAEAAPA